MEKNGEFTVEVNLGFSDAQFIKNENISYLDEIMFDNEKKLNVLSFSDLKQIPHNHLRLFCVQNGIYSVPTLELIEFLKDEIGDFVNETIEIGSGNGVYSRALGIRGTDNYMQAAPQIKELYEMHQQPTVTYGDNVERIEAFEAVKKYRPKIVMGAYCTHKFIPTESWRGGNMFGIEEKKILTKVDKYIHIGHEGVHKTKPILKKPHRTIKADWLVTRAEKQDKNVIWIWDK